MSRKHPHGHGQLPRHGHSDRQGVANYGVVKGKPLRQGVFRPADPRNQPHLHILVDAGDKEYDVTVDVFSQEKSEVRFHVAPNFTPRQAEALLGLAAGATSIGSGDANGIGLDYIRQHLVSEDDLTLLPFDPLHLENDLHNGLADLVEQAIEVGDGAELYAFGSLFDDSRGGRGPNPFNIDPVLGVHNIHMNQGNPPDNHFEDNGTYQDGGLFVHFTGDRERWVAVFLAFQSQSFAPPEAAAAAPGPSRLVPVERRPALLARPAEFRPALDAAQRAHILANLQPIPPPRRNPPVFALEEVIGATAVKAVSASGQIVIHTVGDSGRGEHSPQTEVADAMAEDFQKPDPADHPAFFLHLGDVIYGADKDRLYRDQFYRPYDRYPGQIVAIPGNHDGEVIPGSDPNTLRAFLANFCDSAPHHPEIAGTLPRTTQAQPGVFFLLEAPFVRIIGLYSNVAENPGFISGPKIGDAQKQFLVAQLRDVANRRATGDTDGADPGRPPPAVQRRRPLGQPRDARRHRRRRPQGGRRARRRALGPRAQLPAVHPQVLPRRRRQADPLHRRRWRRARHQPDPARRQFAPRRRSPARDLG